MKKTAEPHDPLPEYTAGGNGVLEQGMKGVHAALVTALLAAGAAMAEPRTLHLSGEVAGKNQSAITREWVWSIGMTTTTFTATGPFEQVTGLSPQNAPLQCQDCQLASSVRFEPGDKVASAAGR